MIIKNGNSTIIISDDIKKLLIPYWFNKLSNVRESLIKKLSGKCNSCLENNNELLKEHLDLKIIADHIFHYSMTIKNSCLTNIAYDLGIVESDHNIDLLDEVLQKFSFMTYHNIEECKACLTIKNKRRLTNE